MRQNVRINDNGGVKRQGCTTQPLKSPRSHASYKEEIDRLKAELEYTKEMSNAFMDERNNLKIQLAEARTEVERLSLENRQMLQGMEWDNQLKSEARQEAARECIKMVKRQAPPLIAHSITAAIMTEFGLEG